MSETEAVGGEETLLSPEPTTTSIEGYVGADNMEWAQSKGVKNVDDLPKLIGSHRELEKTMSGRVKMPTPESSAEEIRAFYQRTGCPENPEGYEVKTSEAAEKFRDEGVENAMKVIAHEQGVSKQAFEAIMGKYYDKMETDLAAGYAAGEKTLREELGANYDTEMKIAQRFCDTCSPEFIDLLEQTGLGNNPVFIKEFINKGKQTMNDTLIKGSSDGDKTDDGYTPQYKDSPEMYATGESPESDKARAYFTARGHVY